MICEIVCRLLSERAKRVPEKRELSGGQSTECCHFALGMWQQLLGGGLKCHMAFCITQRGG